MMNRNLNIFRSRLARRFFAMFVACALIPIVALAVISYSGVTAQLTDQAFDRLRQSAKSHGLSIYENLLLAEHQLDVVATLLDRRKDPHLSSLPSVVVERNGEVLAGITLLRLGMALSYWGKEIPRNGRESILRTPLTGEASGIVTADDGSEQRTIIIIRRLSLHSGDEVVLAGIVKPSFLWGLDQGSSLPPSSEVIIRDDRGLCLFSSLSHPSNSAQQSSPDLTVPSGKQAEVSLHGKTFYASTWSMFLKPKFHIPSWSVTVLEPKDYVLEPIKYFNRVFPLIVLLSLVVVVLLNNWAIRRSLIPIESLMDGAREVADRHFDHRVVVSSDDEFHNLADAFNAMTHEIGIQFQMLSARSDMDRAILSVLDMEHIIVTSLNRLGQFFSFRSAAISILDTENPETGRSFVKKERAPDTSPIVVPFHLNDEERKILRESSAAFDLKADTTVPSYLTALQHPEVDYFIVVPILIRNRLFGLFSLAMDGENRPRPDLDQIRAFCDHLAVAFTNTNLIEELKDLNMGALQALARTVDAKSPWTAGHSLRVARMAVRMGAAMGLTNDEREQLERASLLHDIGKIGIPLFILDKPGKLTDEEYNRVKGHPSTGALILAPIRAYADIIPMVEQHHERYDGEGYPYGLKGDQIHLGARIIAVADSYDAMVSDRPYRKALGNQRAIEIIHKEAGLQFDPAVVETFGAIIEKADDTVDHSRFTESHLLPAGEIRFGHYLWTNLGEETETREIKP